MEQFLATCLYNKALGGGYFKMGLSGSAAYRRTRPGQFVMLAPSPPAGAFLRRPFSIHTLIGTKDALNGMEILYKKVGPATTEMSESVKGRQFSVLGPLGRGFRLPDNPQRVFLVGGGVGIAPLVFLGQRLIESGLSPASITVFIGGRTATDLLCQKNFLEMGLKCILTTDDGSAGAQCLVTQPLEKAVTDHRPDMVYACGPKAMLERIATCARLYQFNCQISIETMMACGMGICLGCAVQPSVAGASYHHVCRDGPVFEASELAMPIKN